MGLLNDDYVDYSTALEEKKVLDKYDKKVRKENKRIESRKKELSKRENRLIENISKSSHPIRSRSIGWRL